MGVAWRGVAAARDVTATVRCRAVPRQQLIQLPRLLFLLSGWLFACVRADSSVVHFPLFALNMWATSIHYCLYTIVLRAYAAAGGARCWHSTTPWRARNAQPPPFSLVYYLPAATPLPCRSPTISVSPYYPSLAWRAAFENAVHLLGN